MTLQTSWPTVTPARAHTRRTLTRAGLSVAAAAGALALGACGAGAGTAPAKKERTAPATVRFMALGSGTAMQWQLQQFEKFNQTVGAAQKIVVAPEPESDQTKLFEKFQATSAAASAPDVTRLKEVWVFESAAKGALAKLDGYFKTDKEFKADDLLPRFQDSMKYKGSHYAVANALSLTIPFFNKSLAQAAGLDPNKPPTNYDEFREWARRMTKPGADAATSQWGFDWYEYGTREIIMNQFLGFVRRFGGQFWNRDRTAVAINGQAGYDVMDYLVTLIQKDRSTVPPDAGVPSPWSAGRTTGKVGMWETTTTGVPNYPRQNPDLSFGVFLWPKKPNNNQNLAAGSSAVAANSKDLDATWEFVKWWNAPEQQMGFYNEAGGNAPSRKSLFEAPPFTTDPLWKIVMPGFNDKDGRTRPLAERYNELAEAMTPHLMDAFRGKVAPKIAVDNAAQAGTAFWKSIGGNADKAGPE
ncbi:MAG TPA: extracellular solute-binding protein [Chloroflexota bacterium]|nr:extracellular solute-binding protein [Chloroflexota bacterium]